jgi:hypothetical protein
VRAVAQLTGVLLPALAFLLNLEIEYVVVPWSCANDANMAVRLVPIALLIVALVGGLVAWREWTAAGRGWPADDHGVIARARFLAVLGLLSSGLFTMLIIAQWMPSFFFGPCIRA